VPASGGSAGDPDVGAPRPPGVRGVIDSAPRNRPCSRFQQPVLVRWYSSGRFPFPRPFHPHGTPVGARPALHHPRRVLIRRTGARAGATFGHRPRALQPGAEPGHRREVEFYHRRLVWRVLRPQATTVNPVSAHRGSNRRSRVMAGGIRTSLDREMEMDPRAFDVGAPDGVPVGRRLEERPAGAADRAAREFSCEAHGP